MGISEAELQTYQKGLSKRLNIKGITKDYDSYRIPLAPLYYNDMNGRISTYIEEYDATHGAGELRKLLADNQESYNDLIAQFIKQSSADNLVSFKKTKEDIRAKGQQLPGVVLSDGRIIDGNRRFTAIRELYKETGDMRFAYFEAVCLPAPAESNKDDWLAIKLLELNLQFDVDEKKDYNRIDFLVSFYKDAMDPNTKLCDERTYCHASGMKAGEFNANVAIVETMLDYLSWRGKPRAFHILKNEKLDGPIEDIAKKRMKMSAEEWNRKKFYIYSYMTIDQTGDRTRKVRNLLDSAVKETTLFSEFKKTVDEKETKDQIVRLVGTLDRPAANPEESAQRKTQLVAVTKALTKGYDDGVFKQQIEKTSTGPIKALETATVSLAAINPLLIRNFGEEDKAKISKLVETIEQLLEQIKDAAE